MQNTRRLRNMLLLIAIMCAITGAFNLTCMQIPNLTPPINAVAFLLFVTVATLDHLAAKKAKKAA